MSCRKCPRLIKTPVKTTPKRHQLNASLPFSSLKMTTSTSPSVRTAGGEGRDLQDHQRHLHQPPGLVQPLRPLRQLLLPPLPQPLPQQLLRLLPRHLLFQLFHLRPSRDRQLTVFHEDHPDLLPGGLCSGSRSTSSTLILRYHFQWELQIPL